MERRDHDAAALITLGQEGEQDLCLIAGLLDVPYVVALC